ncbi:MAG: hypothetical protein GYB65_07425, partial [Chloroflexi bacterium]|nr:hypothetical protein [Chloroflexota bacterium]
MKRMFLIGLLIILAVGFNSVMAQGGIVEEGVPGELVYVPLADGLITLDGDLSDWEGIP